MKTTPPHLSHSLHRIGRRVLIAAAALPALVAGPQAFAASQTWTQVISGNTNVNWSPGGWGGSPIPNGINDIATFNITGATGAFTGTNNLGLLTLGGIDTLTSTRAITITSGTINLATSSGTPSFSGTSNLTISSVLTGTQGFAKNGSARVQLNGNNSGLSGGVSINGGSIVLGSDTALGTGTVTLNGGVLNTGTSTGTRTIGNNIVWQSGNLTADTTAGTGASGVTLQINGTTTLNGASGNLISASPNTNLTQTFIFSNTVSGGTGGNSFTLSTNSVDSNTFTIFRTANNFAHDIAVSGGGSTPVGGKTGTQGIAVGNNNALSGATVTVNSSVQRFVIASEDSTTRTLSNNFVWTSNNAGSGNAPAYTFTLGQSTLATTPGVPTFGGTGNITIGGLQVNSGTGAVPATYRRINVEGGTVGTIGGVFSSTGSLPAASLTVDKVGTGTLVLSNNTHTYAGGLRVNAGTLLLQGSIGGTGIQVNTTGTLLNAGTINSLVTVASGGSLSPGNSPGLGTFSNGVAMTNGSTFVFELNGNTSAGRGVTFDAVDVTGGALSISSGVTSNLVFNLNTSPTGVDWSDSFWATDQTWLVFDNANLPTLASGAIFDTVNVGLDKDGDSLTSVRSGASFSWSQSGNDVYLQYTAVPEPSAVLLLLGAGAVAFVARRKRA